MYCPKCDREFGSVQSRCPDCKSWLRPASSAPSPSPTGGLAAPVALGAPVALAAPAMVDEDEQETCPVEPPATPFASPIPALSRPSGNLPPPPEIPPALGGRSSGWEAPAQNPVLGTAATPPLTWQPQQPAGQMVAASAPTREKPPTLPDSTIPVVVDEDEEEEEESASPLASASPRTLWATIAVLTTCLVCFFGYLLWQSRLPSPAQAQPSPSLSREAQRTGLTALAQGQQLYLEKKWSQAQSQAEMAHSLLVGMPGLSEAEQAPAKKFYRQATMSYAKELAGQAKKALGKGQYQEALGLSQKSASLYSKISDANRSQAQSMAIEGHVYLAQKDFVSAQRAFVKAAELDPKGGYQRLAEEARRASSAGLQSRPTEVVQNSEPEVPSLGDEEAYPQGGPVTVRPSSSSASASAPAQAASGSAQSSPTSPSPNKRRRYRTRPRSTSRPGGQLPSYNDGR